MAFGNLTTDTSAFGQANTSQGLLSTFMLMSQLQQQNRENQRYDAEQQQAERLRAAMSGFDPANPESGLAAIYRADPTVGAKVHASIAERRQSEAAARSTQHEDDIKNQNFAREFAGHFAKGWLSLPPEQQDPALANSWLDNQIVQAQTGSPSLVPILKSIRGNPNWLRDTLQVHANENPYLADQRELEKQRQLNQLPPTPYQQAQLEQQGRTTQAELTNKGAERGNNLRKQFEGLEEVQTYKTIAPLMEGLKHSASLDNKAGDLGLIYGVARVLDPKGVVRESDAGLVGGTGAWFEDLAGQYNAVKGGARLSPEVRQKLLEMAYGKVSASKQAFDVARNQYAGIAARQGIAPEDMGFDAMQVQPPQQPAPQAGMGAPATMGQQQSYQEGQTAINRQTGQRMVYRGGKWVLM